MTVLAMHALELPAAWRGSRRASRIRVPLPNCGHRGSVCTHDARRDLWLCTKCVAAVGITPSVNCQRCGRRCRRLRRRPCGGVRLVRCASCVEELQSSARSR